MIRHFFPFAVSLPVRGLPGRVKPCASRCLLIICPVKSQCLLPRQLRALVMRAVALTAIAAPTDENPPAAARTKENPKKLFFHRGPNRLRLDLAPGFRNAYLQDIAVTVAMAPKAQGVEPWAFTLSALEHQITTSVLISPPGFLTVNLPAAPPIFFLSTCLCAALTRYPKSRAGKQRPVGIAKRPGYRYTGQTLPASKKITVTSKKPGNPDRS